MEYRSLSRAAGSSEGGVMNEAKLRQLRDLAGNEYYAPKLIQQILDALLEPSERGSEGLPGFDLGNCLAGEGGHGGRHLKLPDCRGWKSIGMTPPAASAKADEPINEALCPVCSKPIRFNFVLGWYHVEDSNCSGIRSIPWPHAKAQEPARPKGTCLEHPSAGEHEKQRGCEEWQPLPPESAK